MKNRQFGKRIVTATLAAALWILPVAAAAQTTRIKIPSNKYSVQDDVKLGGQAAVEIERQFPVLRDADANDYVGRVGHDLVAAIPSQFRQPAFNYRFQVVNASDINAFALPGGPMYVNRGMIEAARNEGEMAGVMAHEISHVALRHATAQQTKQTSAKSTLGTIGLILGGAILGGQTGAQIGSIVAQGWMTKYSREYETQADMLGAQIMANAGYDPRDLANMFQTIESQRSGGGAPEFLSSHPNPGNRFNNINREAARLRVSPNPIKITRDFERVQARLRAMPTAPTMAQLQRNHQAGQTQTNPTASGRYTANVGRPSSQYRAFTGVNWLRMNVPSNWRQFAATDSVQFAPEGAYGSSGITRGVMIGVYRGQGSDLNRASQEYVSQVMQGNPYLQSRGGFTRTTLGGRQGLATSMSGRSPVTGQTELVNIFTTRLRNGELFYVVTVAPSNEASIYNNAFRSVLNSIRLSE